MASARRRLLGLYLELRVIPVLLWSFTAITLGTALAWRDGAERAPWGYLAAVAIGVLLQGVVAHCANEVADWRSGTDRDPAPRVISGGSKVVASGLLTLRDLVVIGAAATAAATVLGLLAAWTYEWRLVLYGVAGLAGALLYSLAPLRAAYRPFAGEVVAFTCVWGCVTGAYLLQSGTLTVEVAVLGVAHAAFCVAMLIVHHYLDREPDRRADPPKVTSVVRLGPAAPRYALGWAALALAAGLGLSVAEPRFLILSAGAAGAAAVIARIDPADPEEVTRGELAVILLGIGGGLSCASALSPSLGWALLAAAVLVPLEIRVSSRAHQALFAERAALAGSTAEPAGG